MIYFLYYSFVPNTAVYNRALAYIRSAEKLHYSITVIFFMPDRYKSKISGNFKYVNVLYMWDHSYIGLWKFKYISYWLYLQKIKRRLKKEDKVYIAGHEDILHFISRKKHIELYYEKTENPEVNLTSTALYKPTVEKHFKLCKNKVKELFVISSSLKNYYVDKGISPFKIHIINMTVDPQRFDGVLKQITPDKYIAYCGTISNNKDGVDILIRAFSEAHKSHPDLKLYIIGPSYNSETKITNEELIQKLGLTNNIVFTGIVEASSMPQLLKNAEALVLARPNNTQAQYGFPTKLGEYLLTSNPVIITDVGDIHLFLKDGVNALIAHPNDYHSFAKKIDYLFQHPDKCKIIGKQGRQVALEHFNSDIETLKMLSVISR